MNLAVFYTKFLYYVSHCDGLIVVWYSDTVYFVNCWEKWMGLMCHIVDIHISINLTYLLQLPWVCLSRAHGFCWNSSIVGVNNPRYNPVSFLSVSFPSVFMLFSIRLCCRENTIQVSPQPIRRPVMARTTGTHTGTEAGHEGTGGAEVVSRGVDVGPGVVTGTGLGWLLWWVKMNGWAWWRAAGKNFGSPLQTQ